MINDEPPADTNGIGTPITGNRPITTMMLITAWPTIHTAMETNAIEVYRSLDCRAMHERHHPISTNMMMITIAPTKPSSSPMIAKIDGVDLVTEGVITLQKVTELAEHYGDDSKISLHLSEGKDGVSLLAALLLEQATDINIFYGQAVNTANEGPDVDSDTKDLLVDRLCKALGAQGKNVRVSRC